MVKDQQSKHNKGADTTYNSVKHNDTKTLDLNCKQIHTTQYDISVMIVYFFHYSLYWTNDNFIFANIEIYRDAAFDRD